MLSRRFASAPGADVVNVYEPLKLASLVLLARRMKKLASVLFLFSAAISSVASAQGVEVEVTPPPPPQVEVYPPYPPPPPPPPPRYYVQPPPPGAARYRHYYVREHEPWIRPKPIRGTFGISGFGTFLLNQRGGVEYLSHGGGLSIFGGVELGRIIGIEAKFSSSFHNPAADCVGNARYVWCDQSFLLVQTLGIDLKLHIPTNTRFVPYFAVGPLVGWIGRMGYPTDAVGGGFEAGGGFDIWFSRHGTIGFEVLYRGLLMSDYATYTGSGTYLSMLQLGGTIAAHF